VEKRAANFAALWPGVQNVASCICFRGKGLREAACGGSSLSTFFWSAVDFCLRFGYSLSHSRSMLGPMGENMEWTAPAFEEVCLNCEINSYASAKL
jgi:coenzyme PQQ precursor peptide PqqA